MHRTACARMKTREHKVHKQHVRAHAESSMYLLHSGNSEAPLLPAIFMTKA
jgi:hypothetical protein